MDITNSTQQPGRWRTLASRALKRRIVVTLCLAVSLIFVSSLQASLSPAANRIQNSDFENPNHSYAWFRDGNAQYVGPESCCGQHETFHWPDGAAHGWSSIGNTGDSWDGDIENYWQPGTQYGALAQGISLNPNQRYRLSAWMATVHGNPAYLRWYANGVTHACATKTPTFPGQHVIWSGDYIASCEFTPDNTSGFNAQMAANVSTGEWVIADDWALTPLAGVPQSGWGHISFPISYWARDYPASTDTAANNWNAATGRPLFQKATSEANAQLIIDGIDGFCNGASGGDNGMAGITYLRGYTGPNNRCFVGNNKQLVELNLWYFNRWERDPKASIIGHELGHVLGLAHISSGNCQLMNPGYGTFYWHCGVVRPTSTDASSVQ